MEIERVATEQPTVLAVGADDGIAWVRSQCGAAVSVQTASDPDSAVATVAAEEVDCVVVAPGGTRSGEDDEGDAGTGNESTAGAGDEMDTGAGAGGNGLDTIGRLREAAPAVPIVYAPPVSDGDAASAATAAGATEYLPRELAGVGGDADLAERVERAVEEYDRCRQADREQGMLRELLSSAPLSIYFKDREGRHVAVTSHTTAAFDQSFVGKTDVDLYADEIGEELARESLEDDLRVIEDGERVLDREERHVTPEGEELWLRTSKFPWRDEDGEIVGLIGITRDVTEVKRRERELEQETRRLEQFASFASHDLRNPVSIASGYLERAIEGEGDVEEAHEVVAESLERMDRLIDDLLNMASPEEEREIDGWADLRDLAERAWAVAGNENPVTEGDGPATGDGEAGAAALDLAIPPGTELYAAEGAVRQLFENVFSNAVEHGSTSPDSQARQDALEHAGADANVEVGLTPTGFYVADDGPGIPAEDREAVFDYGYTTGGTGVGLAITKEIADAHGWEAVVTESDTGGARFEFRDAIRRPPPVAEVTLDPPAELTDERDVDGATPPGDATQTADDAWTLRGGGENLWGDLDEYFARYGTVEGDCRIEARVTAIDGVHEYSKAGVLLADEVEAGAVLGFGGVTAEHGAETAWRTNRGAMIDTAQFDDVEGVPAYVRLDRLGDRVTVWASVDGEEWTPLDQAVLDLPETVAVGLAVNSHNTERLCEADFENVRILGLDTQDGD